MAHLEPRKRALKRKNEDADLLDNYRSEKRFLSQAMANELYELKIQSGEDMTDSLWGPNTDWIARRSRAVSMAPPAREPMALGLGLFFVAGVVPRGESARTSAERAPLLGSYHRRTSSSGTESSSGALSPPEGYPFPAAATELLITEAAAKSMESLRIEDDDDGDAGEAASCSDAQDQIPALLVRCSSEDLSPSGAPPFKQDERQRAHSEPREKAEARPAAATI
eukprot:c12962_g1_i1.p1 GENE.c12962_g1_i1~~c12962_g1_i1.p1  ORF type:complete len:224 (+),score=22.53 c12962_g1_i1:171-842(+)